MDVVAAPLVVFATLAACVGIGRPLLARLDTDGALLPLERALAAPLLGAMPLAALIATVGGVVYSAASMAALLVVTVAAAAIAGGYRGLVLSRFAACPWTRAFLALSAVLVMLSAVGAFAPPADHDTVRYHAMLARRDLEWGYIAAHWGFSVYEFMPPLVELLYRPAFALGGGSGAQLLTAAWAAAAALAAAIVAGRLGAGSWAQALAGLFLLAQRATINLGAAMTAEFGVAAYVGLVFVALLAWRERGGGQLALLAGLALSGLALVKLQGLVVAACLAPPVLWAALRGRVAWREAALTVATVVVLLLPLLVRNAVVAGNPVFPAFHNLFGADNLDVFADGLAANVHGEGILFVLSLPLRIFLKQNDFDGMQFGFPVVLVFLPLALGTRDRAAVSAWTALALYVIAWALIMPQMLRFFIGVMPLMAGLAAVGAGRAAALAQRERVARFALVLLAAVVVLSQAGFAAATAARRLPMVLGFVAPLDYLESRPFQWSTYAAVCDFVAARMAPGDTYLAILSDPTYHCPQKSAFPQLLPEDAPRLYKRGGLRPVAAGELAGMMQVATVRWVILTKNLYANEELLVFAKHRYDKVVIPVLAGLAPAFETKTAVVYDGPQTIAALRAAEK